MSTTTTQTSNTAGSAAQSGAQESNPGLTPVVATSRASASTGTPVDAAGYAQTNGDYYLASLDGRTMCAVLVSAGVAGCQALYSLPAVLPQCGTEPAVLAPGAQFDLADGRLKAGCVNHGVFAGVDTRVLPPGSSLVIGQINFVATQDGISGVDSASGQGFDLSVGGLRFFTS